MARMWSFLPSFGPWQRKGLGVRIAYFDCFSGISGDMTLGSSRRCRSGFQGDSDGGGQPGLAVQNWTFRNRPSRWLPGHLCPGDCGS